MKLHWVALSAWLFVAGCHAQAGSSAEASTDTHKRVVAELRQNFNVPPDVDIDLGKEAASEFPGYDKLPVTFTRGERKTTVDFLLSKDQKFLVRWERFDLSKVTLPEEAAKEFMKKEPGLVEGRPVRGDANAPVTIVNFDDFECPYCARMHQALFPGIFDQYKGKIKVIYVDYPLQEIHPWAMHAAVDANCLGAQDNGAYWDYADRVHASQQSIGASHEKQAAETEVDKITREIAGKHNLDLGKLNACMAAKDTTAIQKSLALGMSFGVVSTPTMFVNGLKLDGALPEPIVKKTIDEALAKAAQNQKGH